MLAGMVADFLMDTSDMPLQVTLLIEFSATGWTLEQADFLMDHLMHGQMLRCSKYFATGDTLKSFTFVNDHDVCFSVFGGAECLVTKFTFKVAGPCQFYIPAAFASCTVGIQHILASKTQATYVTLINVSGPVLCAVKLVKVLRIKSQSN
jgi:hypothetical protein